MKSNVKKIDLCRTEFGKWKNPKTKKCETVEKFTWMTINRLQVSLMTFGASLIEIKAPGRDGNCEDVLMGYDKFEDYLRDGKFFFGSTIGPVSDIIENGEFCINGKFHRVGKNYKNKHCVDGGLNAFSRVNWSSFVNGTEVILTHTTDGSNRFPGIMIIQVSFTVKPNNTLVIKTTARSNLVTPIDVSHRLYFNLASHGAGVDEMMNHLVTINSSKLCKKNSDGLFKKSASALNSNKLNLNTLLLDGSIDSLFIIDKKTSDDTQFVTRIIHPKTGRVLEVHSNQPTLHLSTCPEFPEYSDVNKNLPEEAETNFDGYSIEPLTLEYLKTKLTEKEIEFFKCRADTDSIKLNAEASAIDDCLKMETGNYDGDVTHEPIKGKENATYHKNSGFYISCHNFPNAVNHQRQHPEILLKPGQVYENILQLKFGIHVLKKFKQFTEIKFPIKLPFYDKFPLAENFRYIIKE